MVISVQLFVYINLTYCITVESVRANGAYRCRTKKKERKINIPTYSYTYEFRYLSTRKKKIYYIPFHINTFQIEYSKNNLAHSQKQLKTLHTKRKGIKMKKKN